MIIEQDHLPPLKTTHFQIHKNQNGRGPILRNTDPKNDQKKESLPNDPELPKIEDEEENSDFDSDGTNTSTRIVSHRRQHKVHKLSKFGKLCSDKDIAEMIFAILIFIMIVIILVIIFWLSDSSFEPKDYINIRSNLPMTINPTKVGSKKYVIYDYYFRRASDYTQGLYVIKNSNPMKIL